MPGSEQLSPAPPAPACAERYSIPDNPGPLHPADAALLESDEEEAAAKAGARLGLGPPGRGGPAAGAGGPGRGQPGELSWLLRTKYITSATAEPRRPTRAAATAASAAANSREVEGGALPPLPEDREGQIAAIERGFEAAEAPPVHPSNPALTAVGVLPGGRGPPARAAAWHGVLVSLCAGVLVSTACSQLHSHCTAGFIARLGSLHHRPPAHLSPSPHVILLPSPPSSPLPLAPGTVLPDEDMSSRAPVLALFDHDPLADLSRVAALPPDQRTAALASSHLKAFIHATQGGKDHFVAFLVPKRLPEVPPSEGGEQQPVAGPQPAGAIGRLPAEELSGEYEWVREYNHKVKNNMKGRLVGWDGGWASRLCDLCSSGMCASHRHPATPPCFSRSGHTPALQARHSCSGAGHSH